MKRLLLLSIIGLSAIVPTFAQFGQAKKSDIEKFKDSKLIVVLFADSAYNASIEAAVKRFWNFHGSFEFVPDSATKNYSKGDYFFLTFSRSKKSTKLKAKLGASEDDFNGLMVTKKFKKRSRLDEIVAQAFCSNQIDTGDWYPELIRAVQILNNYFNYAIQANSDKEISANYMISNFPADLSILNGKRLLIETGNLSLKGKEDASQLLGMDVEEVDQDELYKAILTQDPDVVYMYPVVNEKYCDKIFVSAAGSEVMYYTTGSNSDPCKCTAKDLKGFKSKIDKALKN
jgi:hypothetical protein